MNAIIVINGRNEEVAKDIAMQICAMLPIAVNRDAVPAEMVEHEKEVIKAEIKIFLWMNFLHFPFLIKLIHIIILNLSSMLMIFFSSEVEEKIKNWNIDEDSKSLI